MAAADSNSESWFTESASGVPTLEQITALIPEFIYIYDLDLEVHLYTNRPLTSMLGYPVDDNPVRKPIFDLMHPEDRQRLSIHHMKVIDAVDGQILEFEYRLKHALGEWRWLRDQQVIFKRHSDHRPRQILGVTRDITQQKRVELAMQQDRAMLRTLIDNIPDHIFVKDANYRFIINNVANALGMGANSPDAATGKTDYDFYPLELADRYRADDKLVIETGQTLLNREEVTTDRAGQHICTLTTKVPLRDAQGEVTGLVGIGRDITERKKAEEALRESEIRFRQLAENIESIFWVLDARARKILYLSPELLPLTGLPREVVYANPHKLIKAIHPDDRSAVLAAWKKMMETGYHQVEFRIITTGSQSRWFSSRAFPVYDKQGKLERITGIADEITQRKELERTAIDLAVEREKIRLLADFIDLTSHEIRTPLSIMNTSLYLLKKTTEPTKQQERITLVEQQIEQITNTIEQMHIMLRLDSAHTLPRSATQLNRLLENLAYSLNTRMKDKSLQLVIQLQDNLGAIQGNDEYLTRAFRNILDNAIRFTPAGGSITIKTYSQMDQVLAEIIDTGIGILPVSLPHIYEPFYKTDEARSSGGNGLGLSIARRIIILHDGQVEAESTPDKGTTIRVRFSTVATSSTRAKQDQSIT